MDPANVVREPDAGLLLPIVVGAHLRGELEDRPLAYGLRDRIIAWQREHDDVPPLHPVVCTDLWYLNTEDLLERPAITIGEPAVNAATAFLASRLPTALVMEETLRVQLDLEFLDLRVCLWGADPAATASCLEVFGERYLDGFLTAAHEDQP